MARTLSVAEQAAYDAAHRQNLTRVWTETPDGAMVDLCSLGGTDRVADVGIDLDIDNPISELRVELLTGTGTASLAPMHEGSLLNRTALGAYAPLLDGGRRIEVETAVLAAGVDPATAVYRRVFRGEIDLVRATSRGRRLQLVCRDLGGRLADTLIEDDHTYGSEAGTPLETVIPEILTDNGHGGVVLATVPEPPGWDVTVFEQSREQLLDGIRKLAQQIGWDARYLWNAAAAEERFTLWGPRRDETVPDLVLGPSRYYDVPDFTVSRIGVRNVVTVYYDDAATGSRESVTVESSESITRYGRRAMQLEEDAESLVRSEAEAERLAEAALSDLAFPKAEKEVEAPYLHHVELGDLVRLSPNGVHTTATLDLAVTTIRHTLSRDKQRTVLGLRGRPSSGYLTWHRRAARPRPEPSTAVGGVLPRIVELRDEDEAGMLATLELAIADPEGRLRMVEMRTQQGTAEPSAWAEESAAPYAASVTMAEKHPSLIYYRVTALDLDGVERVIASRGVVFGVGSRPLPPDVVPVVDAAGQVSASLDGDSDTASFLALASLDSDLDVADVLADGVLFEGRALDTTTLLTLPAEGGNAWVYALAFSGAGASGERSDLVRKRASEAATSAVDGAFRADAQANGTANLSLTVAGPLSRFPVTATFYRDVVGGTQLDLAGGGAPVYTHVFTASGESIDSGDYPGLGGEALPETGVAHWWAVLVDARGLSRYLPAQEDRDGDPGGVVTAETGRADAELRCGYDGDVAQIVVRRTSGTAKVRTFTAPFATSPVRFTAGVSTWDDATTEAVLAVGESRSYTVEYSGSGIVRTMFDGTLTGRDSRAPSIEFTTAVDATYRDRLDVNVVVRSPVGETVTVQTRDTIPGAPTWSLVAGAGLSAAYYVASGTTIGPAHYFHSAGTTELRFNDLPLATGQLRARQVRGVSASGIEGPWITVPLQLAELPVVASFTLTWDEAADVLRAAAIGGAHAAAGVFEISADNFATVHATTYARQLLPSLPAEVTWPLTALVRGTLYRGRFSAYTGWTGSAVSGAIGTPAYAQAFVPAAESGGPELPSAEIVLSSEAVRAVVVEFSGAVGAGGTAPLRWRRWAEGGGAALAAPSGWTTGGLPAQWSLPRDRRRDLVVFLEVEDAAGRAVVVSRTVSPWIDRDLTSTGQGGRGVAEPRERSGIGGAPGREGMGAPVVDVDGATLFSPTTRRLGTPALMPSGTSAGYTETAGNAAGAGLTTTVGGDFGRVALGVRRGQAAYELGGVSSSTGLVLSSQPFSGSAYYPIGTGSNVGALANGAYVELASAKADTGLASDGKVRLVVPLTFAAGEMLCISTSSGRLVVTQVVHGSSVYPVHTGNAVASLTDGGDVTLGAGRGLNALTSDYKLSTALTSTCLVGTTQAGTVDSRVQEAGQLFLVDEATESAARMPITAEWIEGAGQFYVSWPSRTYRSGPDTFTVPAGGQYEPGANTEYTLYYDGALGYAVLTGHWGDAIRSRRVPLGTITTPAIGTTYTDPGVGGPFTRI